MAPARTCVAVAAALFCLQSGVALGAYTPLPWHHSIPGRPGVGLAGQQKHSGWIRDGNQNFIDDLIEHRFASTDSADIIVDLNDSYSVASIDSILGGFGRIMYIPRLVSCVLIRKALVSDLDSIAGMPSVAMVELQTPLRPTLDVAGRAIQARTSSVYSSSAQASGFEGETVNIAIVDVGVADGYDAFKNEDGTRAFVAGFDATKFEDIAPSDGMDDSGDEPGDGTTNPDPDPAQDHATHVAGIALARPVAGRTCRDDPSDTVVPNCSGVAPKAGLVDIKVALHKDMFFSGTPVLATEDVFEGLDWIAANAARFNIQVVNLSFCDHIDDDGLGALSAAVDALVAQGVVVVAAHGNSINAGVAKGTQLTGSPGSASYAITVAGVFDQNTVLRDDDAPFKWSLVGPRKDCAPPYSECDPGALKPDISAPAEKISTVAFTSSPDLRYTTQDGTSLAAPAVAGAVALLRGRWPTIDPGSIKDLIRRTADRSMSSFVGPDWDVAMGSGIINVADLVNATATGDVRFDNCVGPGSGIGSPCELTSPLPSWNNYLDITTATDPEVGVPNTITGHVYNDATTDVNVQVTFALYTFGAGTRVFHHIGTKGASIAAKSVGDVTLDWTPEDEGHQCLQLSIQYGYDSDFRNNVTQRNIWVAPSEYTMGVENPFFVPARFHVVPKSDRAGWNCTIDKADFRLDPVAAPQLVHISFHAPAGAAQGQRANCDVAVYATKAGARDSVLVGGVTVQTFVPEDCRLVGRVVDPKGHAIPDVKLSFMVVQSHTTRRAKWERERTATTDPDGVFSLKVLPFESQKITLVSSALRGEVTLDPPCGVGTLQLELGPEGVRVLKSH